MDRTSVEVLETIRRGGDVLPLPWEAAVSQLLLDLHKRVDTVGDRLNQLAMVVNEISPLPASFRIQGADDPAPAPPLAPHLADSESNSAARLRASDIAAKLEHLVEAVNVISDQVDDLVRGGSALTFYCDGVHDKGSTVPSGYYSFTGVLEGIKRGARTDWAAAMYYSSQAWMAREDVLHFALKERV